MVNKTISLTEEVNNKLKNEENASALINKLLLEHYKFNSENLEDIEEEIEKLKNKEEEKLKEITKELNELNKKKEIVVKKTEFIEKKQKTNLEKQSELMKNIRENFKEFGGRYPTDEELKTYFIRFTKEEKGFNLMTYLEELGLYNFDDENKTGKKGLGDPEGNSNPNN